MKPIYEPRAGDKVFYRKDGRFKPVTIIKGAYYRNDRVSNFWKWRDDETGEVEEDYGCFYIDDELEWPVNVLERGYYSVPDTNVGEYINREDALMCLTGEWTELTDEIIHRFIKRIKNLPLMVLPKQRMGQWEWVQYDGNPNIGNWHCSECHCIVEYGKPSYKYCPQCGCKMQEVG